MGIARAAHLVLLAWFVYGAGQPPPRTSKEPYREIERGPAYSLIEIDISGARPSFGAGIVVLFKAVYDIAKERGFAYAFAVEPAANAPPPPGGAQRVATVKVFMTKDRETPLQTLLGADHSQRAQEQFDREGWMSVRQLARMFEADTRRVRANDPLSDLIGVYSLTAEGEPFYRVSKKGQDYFLESRQPAGWSTPVRLVAVTQSQRAQAAAQGIVFSAGLRMREGSADQGFDILRIEEALPGSGRSVILHVLFSWFGPNLLYKLP